MFQAWLEPLTGDSAPCGTDISLEASFDALKAEVDKSSSLYADQATDWDKVLTEAGRLLSEESKDLWVLCYGLKAAYELRGLAAAAEGLEAAGNFLEKFWEHLFPRLERPARRAAPLSWLVSKFETVITAEGFPGDQGETALALKAALSKTADFLEARLPEAGAALAGLAKQIPALQEKEESPADAAKPAPGTAIPFKPELYPALTGGQPPSEGVIPEQFLPQTFRSLQDQGRRLAQHYLCQNPLDWRAYYLHRAALWSAVTQIPQSDAEGRTQLRPLPPDRAAAYRSAVEFGQFSEILPPLERSAAKMPFWFDGHRLVAKCLEALRGEQALAVLLAGLASFIKQFPELKRLKFYDGSTFAGPETLAWLETLSLNQPGNWPAAPIGLKSVGGGLEDHEEALFCEAVSINNDQGFEKGLEHLGPSPVSRSRSCIRHGLLTARYCLTAGRPEAGLALLQELYARLDEWGLLEWEPGLTAEILNLILIGNSRQETVFPEARSRRLYWLDLPSALRCFKA